MLDRWLTIELQYDWEIVTPWGNRKDEDLLPNTLEVAMCGAKFTSLQSTLPFRTNHYRNYQTLNFMRPMCIAIYLDSNAQCNWRTEPRRLGSFFTTERSQSSQPEIPQTLKRFSYPVLYLSVTVRSNDGKPWYRLQIGPFQR